MFGKAPRVLPSVGLSGSGALSHVYIQHPPLRCRVPGSVGLFFDDANKLVLSPTAGQVFGWKTNSLAQQSTPTSDSVGEGPVLSIRYSLDGKVIAIQRSNIEIEFRNRESREAFVQKCKSESESILGFFWTDCPTCDLIIIKTCGLDLCTYEPGLKALRLVDTRKLNVNWYVYTHESRMILLASGMQSNTFTAFQFSFGGVIRLPRFEMAMTKAEANQKPVLYEEDLHIITVYGRIYCLQVDRVAMLLHFYRFYRDAVMQQGSFPIYSSKIAVNVVDNVILVHQVDAKVVIMYDIISDSHVPISAPLPLLLRGLPRVNGSSSGFSNIDAVDLETDEICDHEDIIYGDGWTFLIPDLICDAAHGTLWRIHLDLEAIAASSSEVSSVLEFLQRRKLESIKAKQLSLSIMRTQILERQPVPVVSRAIDTLVMSYLHSVKMGVSIQGRLVGDIHINSIKHGAMSGGEREYRQSISGDVQTESTGLTAGSTGNIRSSIGSDAEENMNLELLGSGSGDSHTAADIEQPLQPQGSGAGENRSESDVPGQRELQVASAAISPDEMYQFIFASVEEEMAGDPAYLVAIIVEYLRSAASEKLKVHPNLNMMTIQLLARSERFAELWMFVLNKIVEPSKEVALQLLELGRQNFMTRKLGMDMLRKLMLHRDYVLLLVQDGYYIESLRYARKNKVISIRPSVFLEAAVSSNNSQHLAAVLRFFMDSNPTFKNTTDYSMYRRILNEMSAVAAA
ncbi:regulator of MON1-CCZ1 complex-like isoform X2 [Papaver somniferum]|uniref:regulator of MON1-CCZ1 complex-like isoform X2 n=1 Tax=Papaver somniferum TaxID=3469 RepID=UPI000E702D90|nr:regulator of MON1-CCZ1 complex-like isoform X2 [Papaver somniferum]